MENLLLPRRERLFNYGGKLHFQNFSALFQGVLSTSFPSGKYHCKAKSLSKTISRLKHIIAKGNKVSLPGDASHTALLKSHCRGRQSVVLCLHTPFPREYTVSRGDPNLAMPRNDIKYFVRKIIFALITPPLKSQNFDAIKPHKYTVSCGDPCLYFGMTECVARN